MRRRPSKPLHPAWLIVLVLVICTMITAQCQCQKAGGTLARLITGQVKCVKELP